MSMYVISTKQLVIACSLISVLSASLFGINTLAREYFLLPEVMFDANGQCLKVVNYDNGHTFNCNDVNVILRRYRKS